VNWTRVNAVGSLLFGRQGIDVVNGKRTIAGHAWREFDFGQDSSHQDTIIKEGQS
jgi:hypothetical protein